jgi:hypothetical protein
LPVTTPSCEVYQLAEEEGRELDTLEREVVSFGKDRGVKGGHLTWPDRYRYSREGDFQ